MMCPGRPEIESDPSELVVKTCCCPVCCPLTVIVCWSDPGSIVTVIVLFPLSVSISVDVFPSCSAKKFIKSAIFFCCKDRSQNSMENCTTHHSPLAMSFLIFFGVRFLKCLNSKWRLKLRDCRMVAEQMGHVAGCSDCDFDFGSENNLWRLNFAQAFWFRSITVRLVLWSFGFTFNLDFCRRLLCLFDLFLANWFNHFWNLFLSFDV